MRANPTLYRPVTARASPSTALWLPSSETSVSRSGCPFLRRNLNQACEIHPSSVPRYASQARAQRTAGTDQATRVRGPRAGQERQGGRSCCETRHRAAISSGFHSSVLGNSISRQGRQPNRQPRLPQHPPPVDTECSRSGGTSSRTLTPCQLGFQNGNQRHDWCNPFKQSPRLRSSITPQKATLCLRSEPIYCTVRNSSASSPPSSPCLREQLTPPSTNQQRPPDPGVASKPGFLCSVPSLFKPFGGQIHKNEPLQRNYLSDTVDQAIAHGTARLHRQRPARSIPRC